MKRFVIAGGLALLAGAPAAAQVVVPDASFESPGVGSSFLYNPTVAGVTFNAGSGVAGSGSAWGFTTPPSGSQVAFIQSTGSFTGQITLAVTGLTTGTGYTVSFYLSRRPNYAVNPIAVSAVSGGVTGLGLYTPTSDSFTAFTTAGFFTANGSTAAITFAGLPFGSGDQDTGLDLVSVNPVNATPGAVPEPATWGTVIVGLGLVGASLRRRRRTWGVAAA